MQGNRHNFRGQEKSPGTSADALWIAGTNTVQNYIND
jgi:hypothetical protein